MANKKQSPVMAIILIAIIVVAGFFIVRTIWPPRPPAPPATPMIEYLVCMECLFRISMEEIMEISPLMMECLECGSPLTPEEVMPPPE